MIQPGHKDEAVRRRWMIVGLGAVLLVFVANVLRHEFLTDDAFIYFRYARNLANGLGPVFNPGEHVEGYTGVLWLLLLTAGMFAGVPPELFSVILGTTAGASTLAIVAWTARKIAPDAPPWLSLFAPFLLATNRTFSAWCTGGLETALFTLLVTASFAMLLTEDPERRRVSPWLFALAYLTRPEGALFFAIGAVLVLWTTLRGEDRNWRRPFVWALPATFAILGQVALRLWYYGYPLPNTFYVKVSGTWWDLGWDYLIAFALETGAFVWLPLAALIALCDNRRLRLASWTGLAVTVPYLIYLASIGGDHFEFRPMHAVLPFLLFPVPFGASALWSRIVPRARFAATAITIAVAALAMNVVPAAVEIPSDRYRTGSVPEAEADNLPSPLRHLPWRWWFAPYNRISERLVSNFAAVRVEEHRLFWRQQVAESERLQAALARGLLRPDDRIALSCVGVVPYYTGLYTMDLLGLTNEAVAHQRVETRGMMAHEKAATADMVCEKRVTFVALLPARFFNNVKNIHAQASDFPYRTIYFTPFGGTYFAFYSCDTEESLARKMAQRGFPLHVFENRQYRRYGPAKSDLPPGVDLP